MGERRAGTKKMATDYARAKRVRKGRVQDELVALTGWHRGYARAALREALKQRAVRARAPRAGKYDDATKPGSLLRDQITVRTWADWDSTVPGFVEIDPVGPEGGNSSGEFYFTLPVTDIATGWTINRAVRNKARKWMLEAIDYVLGRFPFPVLGIDSDNGSEFINYHLLAYCEEHSITFTRSPSGNKNDGCYVEQKNRFRVRELVGYCRYDTAAELVNANH
jgi:hypothetical protein